MKTASRCRFDCNGEFVLNYFWTHQYDLPPGTGYPHFGIVHCFSVAAVILLVIIGLSLIRESFVKCLPVLLLIMECSKDYYLFSIGRFDEGYLPLHLCSLGIPVFIMSVFGNRTRAFFREIAVVLILPGAVAAILFPDWNMYPVINFMNLYSWLWHGILVLFPLLLIKFGMVWPSIRNLWMPIVFLCLAVPPIYLFDKKAECNYLFINWPPAGTPLEIAACYMGVPGYLAGYALLVIVVIMSVYALFGLTRMIFRKP